MTPLLIVYMILVGVAGTAAIIYLLRMLGIVQERRLVRLQKREALVPVDTDSPVDDAAQQVVDRGIESIEKQTTVVRRLLIPSVCLMIIVAIGTPFLPSVPGTMISVVVAALTVIGGIAARPTIENAICGLVISLSKLINIGDTVLVEGHYGTVEDITVTHTAIKVWDWRRYVVPNSKMLDSTFVNYSLFDEYLWVHVEFWVSFAADLDVVRTTAIEAAARSDHYVDYEEPRFWVMEMGKEGIRCWVAAWADSPSDGWSLANDVRTELIGTLRRKGIETHCHHHAVTGESPLGAVAARER
ncbi:Miniconductance mechanosensitive channel MscM precursor [Maioricimonas rarisocia]|uniref:Miniconductance mechanosensitive channel MscM n=1 Tax=Maioricimonas rarisocia TaxID=2528026 RepID=A0A517ZER2_9PLAN|nr:mechanosensitive ion channel family protein [Maioricimonas rarisocia]QDU40944.1 Miniconductance mechanosensitive channel MscM precursor [Maioricimonas rarisocia]